MSDDNQPVMWLILIAIFAFGFWGAYWLGQASWKTDCDNYHAHITAEKARYSCERIDTQ